MIDCVNAHLSDSSFTIDWLADEAGMSRRNLDRRLHEMTGQTAAEILRRFRMERAVQLLRANAGSVSDVAYAVGFNSPAHFSKAFRDRFGRAPSDLRRRTRTAPDVQY